jgi:hypothetical protein
MRFRSVYRFLTQRYLGDRAFLEARIPLSFRFALILFPSQMRKFLTWVLDASSIGPPHVPPVCAIPHILKASDNRSEA